MDVSLQSLHSFQTQFKQFDIFNTKLKNQIEVQNDPQLWFELMGDNLCVKLKYPSRPNMKLPLEGTI